MDSSAESHPVLAGPRMVEVSAGIAGPMAGMLLADNGADVVRVERPGDGRLRDAPGCRVWNRGTWSVVLDISDAADRRRLLDLVDGDGAVIESSPRRSTWHAVGTATGG